MRPATPARCAPHSVLRKRILRPVFIPAAALLLLSIEGCAALQVTHRPAGSTGKPASTPGVPFYPKKARCRQEVVWFQPVYTLTLAALLADKDGALQTHPRGAVVLSRSHFESQEVTDLMKLLNNRPTDEGTVLRAWQKVVVMADSRVLSRDFGSLAVADRILLGRSAAPVVYVDYGDQYYVNAKIPLAGSANLDAKVAVDGSLSEVSGQVQNQTLQTILSALPISGVITGGLGLGGKGSAAVGEVEAFQLTVSISGYRHTLARLVDYPAGSKPCPVVDDLALADATEYKREDITTASDATKPDKTGSANAPAPKDSAASQNKNSANQEKNP
jgi:hypothetical protein